MTDLQSMISDLSGDLGSFQRVTAATGLEEAVYKEYASSLVDKARAILKKCEAELRECDEFIAVCVEVPDHISCTRDHIASKLAIARELLRGMEVALARMS